MVLYPPSLFYSVQPKFPKAYVSKMMGLIRKEFWQDIVVAFAPEGFDFNTTIHSLILINAYMECLKSIFPYLKYGSLLAKFTKKHKFLIGYV